jgi:chaperonin GroES
MRLELEHKIQIDPRTALSPNLTHRFGKDDLARIGEVVWSGYDRDCSSRSSWVRRNRAAMELALQVKPGKSFPWPNASNVAFPLLTIAALQFHSRAYPALFSGAEIVKYRIPGMDSSGALETQANLVGRYMSHQAMDLDESFEEQHDRLLIHVPIVGCAFVKTRYSTADRHNVSELVPAEDLVIDYFAKSVESAWRKTQHVILYRNDVYERCTAGVFRNILEESWYVSSADPQLPLTQAERDRVTGFSRPASGDAEALLFLEQHTWLDLDGDGYAEPYIVTIENSSKAVVRIVARWEHGDDVERLASGRILRIRASEYYTKYELIPSPDGGIYGLGFGALLGPLNESVDTIVNQLIDAGTMATAAGGFLSRGVKVRGGAMTFQPFGWNHVDSTGDDLRKGIFPLPVREPSAVLFNLLSLLINYTQRISGSTDVMAGENPGQNTAVRNMQAMLEQGMKIYNATFKRLWRAMRAEFQKLFILNARHMPLSVPFGDTTVGRELFLGDPSALVPMADPNMVSDAAKLQQAITLKQAAMATPGYDPQAVEKYFLRSLKVDSVEAIYPGPQKFPPPPDPKMALEQIKTQREQLKLQVQQQQFVLSLMEEQRLNNAKIMQLQAQAAKLVAEAGGAKAGHQLAALEMALTALKDHNKAVTDRLSVVMKGMSDGDGATEGDGGGMEEPSGDAGVPEVPPVETPFPDGGMGAGELGPGLGVQGLGDDGGSDEGMSGPGPAA